MRDFGYSEKGQSVTVADLALWRRILRYSADYRLPIGVAVILSLGVTGDRLTGYFPAPEFFNLPGSISRMHKR